MILFWKRILEFVQNKKKEKSRRETNSWNLDMYNNQNSITKSRYNIEMIRILSEIDIDGKDVRIIGNLYRNLTLELRENTQNTWE